MKNTLPGRMRWLLLVAVFSITNSCAKKGTDAVSETAPSIARSGPDKDGQTLCNTITPVQSSDNSKASYTAIPAHQIHVYLLVLVRF